MKKSQNSQCVIKQNPIENQFLAIMKFVLALVFAILLYCCINYANADPTHNRVRRDFMQDLENLSKVSEKSRHLNRNSHLSYTQENLHLVTHLD